MSTTYWANSTTEISRKNAQRHQSPGSQEEWEHVICKSADTGSIRNWPEKLLMIGESRYARWEAG